jgi:hypothetical protein
MYAGEDMSMRSTPAQSMLSNISFGFNTRCDDLDMALYDWAHSRLSSLGRNSSKIIRVDDIINDPLSYIITKYANMPPARSNQYPISVVRSQFILEYKKACRQGEGRIRLYIPLLKTDPKEVPDTCKLLAHDLAIFFVSNFSKSPDCDTMSLCILPSIAENRGMFTPEFFQLPNWREIVTSTIRQVPSAALCGPLQLLLEADPVRNSPPFKQPLMEQDRQTIMRVIENARTSYELALDVSYAYDDRRSILLREVERRLIRASAYIGNIIDVGLDGLGVYEDVELERRDNVSWITLQAMGRYSSAIRRQFGIKVMHDPYE